MLISGLPRPARGLPFVLGACILAAVLAACGGKSHLAAPHAPAAPLGLPAQPGGKTVPTLPEAQSPATGGLPALSALGTPQRSLSSTVYGFQPLVPSQTIQTINATALPNTNLVLTPATGPAYALYGLSGFRDGAYPVSAKLTFSAAVTSCFVAFPDYAAGRWVLEGPFTGSAEVPIVLRGQPQGYMSFISPGGNGYFAVLFPAGNAGGTLSAVSFGVNGGDLGPAAPVIDGVSNGDKGVVLNWLSSTDEGAADFAGYIVERAPQFSGSFAALTASPTRWNDYFDSTTAPATTYRYRLVAVDLSGNRSAPSVVMGGMDPTSPLDPVVRISFTPNGPYHAPAPVAYDMSASYDPEGEALFGFGVEEGITSIVLGSTENGNFTLQPGAYFLQCSVQAGTRSGNSYAWLKAYPQWQSASRLIRAPQPSHPGFLRLALSTPFLLPGDNTPWLAGYDLSSDGIAFLRTVGGNLSYFRVPMTSFASGLSHPVVAGPACWILGTDQNIKLDLARFDGSTAQLVKVIDGGEPLTGLQGALANTASDDIRYFYTSSNNGTDYSVTSGDNNVATSEVQILATGANSSSAISALYNPGADVYDIFFATDTAKLRWIRWTLSTNTISGDAILSAAGPPDAITSALDPMSGHTSVAYHIGNDWTWQTYDGVAWSVAETVNSTPADNPGQMAYKDGEPFLLASTNPGQTTLYERTGPATWVERNKPLPATAGGTSCGLIPGTAAGELIGSDGITVGSEEQTRMWVFDSAGNDTTLLNLPGTSLAAFDYTATGGNDGLHLVMPGSLTGGSLEHWTSPDGVTWTSGPVAYNLVNEAVVASSTGDVYLGGYNQSSSDGRLYWWDPVGSAFSPEATSIVCSNSNSMSLNGSLATSGVLLTGFDSAGPQLASTSGKHSSGYMNSNIPVPDTAWRGHQGLISWYGMIGGTTENKGTVWQVGMNQTQLYNPQAEDSFSFMSQLVVNNYSYQTAVAAEREPSGLGPVKEEEVFEATYGPLLAPQRCEFDVSGSVTMTSLPFAGTTIASFPYGEYRRTVSMATTRSLNAVSLVSALDGSATHFDWLADSGWEDLQLPDNMGNMMAPQFVAGYDGRWHIIYYDWVTDSVMIRSTL